MSTLVIFAALIYLVNHVGLSAKTTSTISFVLAFAGILLWVLSCFFGLNIPRCFAGG